MAIHPNSLANLRSDHRFKAGDEWTGNRLGKPKGTKSRTTLYREFFSLEIGKLKAQDLIALSERLGLPKGATIQDLIIAQHLSLISSKREDISLKSIKLACDSAFGKVMQPTAVLQETVINAPALAERIKKLKEMYRSEY